MMQHWELLGRVNYLLIFFISRISNSKSILYLLTGTVLIHLLMKGLQKSCVKSKASVILHYLKESDLSGNRNKQCHWDIPVGYFEC